MFILLLTFAISFCENLPFQFFIFFQAPGQHERRLCEPASRRLCNQRHPRVGQDAFCSRHRLGPPWRGRRPRSRTLSPSPPAVRALWSRSHDRPASGALPDGRRHKSQTLGQRSVTHHQWSRYVKKLFNINCIRVLSFYELFVGTLDCVFIEYSIFENGAAL